MLAMAWADPRVTAVVAGTDPGNAASQRVLEKAGFGRMAGDGEFRYRLRRPGLGSGAHVRDVAAGRGSRRPPRHRCAIPAPTASAPAPRASGYRASRTRGGGGTRWSWAEEQRGRRLARRPSARWQDGDLQFSWRQVVDRARVAGAPCRAGGGELGPGALGPGVCVEALEDLDGRPQLLAGEHPVASPTQALAVGEPGPRRLKVGVERLLVVARTPGRTSRTGRQARLRRPARPWTPQRTRERPRLPLGRRRGQELASDSLCIIATAESQIGIHELGSWGQIDVGNAELVEQPLLILEFLGRRAASPSPRASSPSAAVAHTSCRRVPSSSHSASASTTSLRHSSSRPRRACSHASPESAKASAVC